jgi:porin
MHLSRLRFFSTALAIATIGLVAGRPASAAPTAVGRWTTALELTLEGDASLRGGQQAGQALHGQALAKTEWAEADQPGGAVTWRLFASAMTLAGRGPTEKFLGDFLAASNIEGFDSTRLYSWWIEAHQGEWSLRAGALLADDEFTATEGGGYFFNSAFGWPSFISANTVNTGPAFFAAAPGVRFDRHFGSTALWRLGIYDGDTFDSAAGDPAVNRHGWHYQLGGQQGWFVISEVAFSPPDSANRLKVGAWLHTANFDDVRDDTTGRRLAATGGLPQRHSQNHGAYAAVERTLRGKSGEAGYITAFARAGVAPADRNTLDWSLDTGLACTGLIPGRASDVTALGFVHANFSPRYAAHVHATDRASPKPDFEQVVELNHNLVLNERFTLQPDLQFIRHPGGSSAQRDAAAFLLRLKTSY